MPKRIIIVTKYHEATEFTAPRITAKSYQLKGKPFYVDGDYEHLREEAASIHLLAMQTMGKVSMKFNRYPSISEPLPDSDQWVHIFERSDK